MFVDVPPELRAQFLEDHREVEARRKPGALSATAIRFGSLDMRDLFATFAFGKATTYVEVLEMVESGDIEPLSAHENEAAVEYLAKLATVLVMQRLSPDDLKHAFAIYQYLDRNCGIASLDAQHQSVYYQVGLRLRGESWAAKQLNRSRNLHRSIATAFECNLSRKPDIPPESDRKWLRELSNLIGAGCTLIPDRGPSPFDQLECESPGPSNRTDEVSAIIPVLGDAMVLTGLRSALRQTHRPQQILLVTDRDLSAEERIAVEGVEEAQVIRVEPATAFGAAVNVALKKVAGDFVLLLDPSDWCTPKMVERHLERLGKSRETVVVRTARFRVTDDLAIGPFGVWRPDVYARTVLFRRRVVEDLGYFDEIGPESIEEFIDRTRLPYGKAAVSISRSKLLALSLDGREEVPYRESEERMTAAWFPAYRSAYWRWHQKVNSAGSTPYVPSPLEKRPFVLPPGLGPEPDRREYDLVFASDWRPYGGPAKSMIEEIKAALAIGLRVGVMNLEAVRMMTPETRALCGPIQQLINSGAVDIVGIEDEVDIDSLIIRYPLVLQFDRQVSFPGKVRQLLIHANQPPHEADGSDLRYFTRDCEINAEKWFGVEPVWVAQGPQAEKSLVDTKVPVSRPLADFHIPGLLDPNEWFVRRDRFRFDRPVIGRHSRDHHTKWPGRAETLLKIYPDDLNYDIRIMGGDSTVRQMLGGDVPRNWISYGYDETGVREFLFQLDFWVYFPNEVRIEAFGRAILEAMASGCVVILPEVFRSTFGDGALYCEPDDVRSLIDELYSDLEAFKRQSRRGQALVEERFSHQWFRDLLTERILAPNRVGAAGPGAPVVPPQRIGNEIVNERPV